MKTWHHVFASIAAACCCTVLLAQATKPVQDADGEYSMSQPLVEGQQIPMLWKSAAVVKATLKDSTVKVSDVRFDAQMTLSVGKVAKESVAATVQFKRLTGQAEMLGSTDAFDTDKPESIRMDDGQPSYLGLVRQGSWIATLDPLGRCSKITPDVQLAKAIGESFADMKDTRVKLVSEMMARIAMDPSAYLPQASVKEGETWTVTKRAMYLRPDGTPVMLDEVSECKLLKVEGAKAAKIQIAGKCLVPDADPKTLSEFEITGAMRVDLTKNHCLRWRVQMVGRTKDSQTGQDLVNHTIVNEGATGEDALAPASQPATTTSSK